MSKEIALGFGNKELKVTLPAKRILHIVEGKHVDPIEDVEAAVKEALASPIGTPPLKQVVAKGDKVAIVVSDVTRGWVRHDLFLPTLLNELNAAGVPDSDVYLVVGLGAHRYHTDAENVAVYGQEVVNRVAIYQSHAQATEDFTYIGKTTRGVEASVHNKVASADKVILTGGIVYHLMGGFGGGRKSILPGVASYSSIQGNHRFCLHDVVGKGVSPNCVSGKLEGNNMHEDMTEISALLNPAFLLNAVFTAEGKFARFVAGHWYDAWREGCRTVEEIFGVSITAQADLVVASAGGFPKDINLYQSAKTIDNAYLAVKPDGAIIIVLECREIMDPPDFSGWFDYESLFDREVALRAGFTVPGFIALKIGQIAKLLPIIIVSLPENAAFIKKCGMIPATTVEEAISIAETKLGRQDYSITVMPQAANTVPILK